MNKFNFAIMHTMKMQSIAGEIYRLATNILRDNKEMKFIEVNQLDLTTEGLLKLVKFKICNQENTCDFISIQ